MASRSWIVAFSFAGLVLCGAAAADEIEAVEPQVQTEVQMPMPEAPAPGRETFGVPGGWTGEQGGAAIEEWIDRTPWGYGTDYLFPLTRSLTDSEVPLWGKIPVYPLAVIFDLAQLPLGAIGGLWGS